MLSLVLFNNGYVIREGFKWVPRINIRGLFRRKIIWDLFRQKKKKKFEYLFYVKKNVGIYLDVKKSSRCK